LRGVAQPFDLLLERQARDGRCRVTGERGALRGGRGRLILALLQK